MFDELGFIGADFGGGGDIGGNVFFNPSPISEQTFSDNSMFFDPGFAGMQTGFDASNIGTVEEMATALAIAGRFDLAQELMQAAPFMGGTPGMEGFGGVPEAPPFMPDMNVMPSVFKELSANSTPDMPAIFNQPDMTPTFQPTLPEFEMPDPVKLEDLYGPSYPVETYDLSWADRDALHGLGLSKWRSAPDLGIDAANSLEWGSQYAPPREYIPTAEYAPGGRADEVADQITQALKGPMGAQSFDESGFSMPPLQHNDGGPMGSRGNVSSSDTPDFSYVFDGKPETPVLPPDSFNQRFEPSNTSPPASFNQRFGDWQQPQPPASVVGDHFKGYEPPPEPAPFAPAPDPFDTRPTMTGAVQPDAATVFDPKVGPWQQPTAYAPAEQKREAVQAIDNAVKEPKWTGDDAKIAPGYTVPKGEVKRYVQEAAAKRGIDPKIAQEVVRREGLHAWQSSVVKNGKREESWGPLQLYTGGGVGNKFQKDTGLDPRDPKNWQATVDYGLDHAVKNGWGAWYGAKAAGITGKMGIGPNAAPQGITAVAQNKAPAEAAPESEYPKVAQLNEGRQPAHLFSGQRRMNEPAPGILGLFGGGQQEGMPGIMSGVQNMFNDPGALAAMELIANSLYPRAPVGHSMSNAALVNQKYQNQQRQQLLERQAVKQFLIQNNIPPDQAEAYSHRPELVGPIMQQMERQRQEATTSAIHEAVMPPTGAPPQQPTPSAPAPSVTPPQSSAPTATQSMAQAAPQTTMPTMPNVRGNDPTQDPRWQKMANSKDAGARKYAAEIMKKNFEESFKDEQFEIKFHEDGSASWASKTNPGKSGWAQSPQGLRDSMLQYKAQEKLLPNYKEAKETTDKEQGKTALTSTVNEIAGNLLTLDNMGAIPNPYRGTASNVSAWIKASPFGQTFGQMQGTNDASVRQNILAANPAVLAAVKKATGMTGTELNSNVELNFWMQQMTNPQSDIFTNLAALNRIDKLYGSGDGIIKSLPPDWRKLVDERERRMVSDRESPNTKIPAAADKLRNPAARKGWSAEEIK
jgi:hypothetical protein